jgi:phasin family protein
MGLAGTKKGEIAMSQKPKAGNPYRAARKTVAVAPMPAVDTPVVAAPEPEAAPVEAESIEIVPVEAAAVAVAPQEEPDAPFIEAQPEVATEVAEPVPAETAKPTEASVETEPMPLAASLPETPVIPAEDPVLAVSREVRKSAFLFSFNQPHSIRGLNTMTMMKSTEDLVAFSQANVEAFVKSGQIWSAGVQELTKQFATTAKASFDESVSTFKAMSTAKSVKEALEMQSDFAKTSLEKALAESNKLADAGLKLTEETLAPITARLTVAAESFSKAA